MSMFLPGSNGAQRCKKGEFDEWMIEAVVNDLKLSQTREYENNTALAGAYYNAFIHHENWEDKDVAEFEKWWDESRPGIERAEWIEFFADEEYVDGEDLELQEYLIRITPLKEEVPLPPLDEDYKWVGDFEMRKPKLCPKGLKSSKYR